MWVEFLRRLYPGVARHRRWAGPVLGGERRYITSLTSEVRSDYDRGRVFLDSSTRAASVIGSDCLLPPNSPGAVGTLRSCKVSIVSR